jgi:hypothetical protein
MDKLQAGLVGAAGTADMHAPLVTIVILNHNYAEFVNPSISRIMAIFNASFWNADRTTTLCR